MDANTQNQMMPVFCIHSKCEWNKVREREKIEGKQKQINFCVKKCVCVHARSRFISFIHAHKNIYMQSADENYVGDDRIARKTNDEV